jgi:hypothetical protein
MKSLTILAMFAAVFVPVQAQAGLSALVAQMPNCSVRFRYFRY